jgi:hypothetical protein
MHLEVLTDIMLCGERCRHIMTSFASSVRLSLMAVVLTTAASVKETSSVSLSLSVFRLLNVNPNSKIIRQQVTRLHRPTLRKIQ